MTQLVERFALLVMVALVVASVAIEGAGGGGMAAMVSAGLSAFCLGLALYYVSRGVMLLVEPRDAQAEARGRLELLRMDLVQLRSSLESVRLDARIQRLDAEEREELEAPLRARVEAVEERIARVEREGDEDLRDEEICELAKARMARVAKHKPADAVAEEGGEA